MEEKECKLRGCNPWYAVMKDPCPSKRCKQRKCHNFGKPFFDQKQLILCRPEGNIRASEFIKVPGVVESLKKLKKFIFV